jgi:hypothetical protein
LEIGGVPPPFWIILGPIGLKNSKGLKKLYPFEPKSAQINAKIQRRGREMYPISNMLVIKFLVA